jgi:hypothetical protein
MVFTMSLEAEEFHVLFKSLHLSILFLPLFTSENKRSNLELLYTYAFEKLKHL